MKWIKKHMQYISGKSTCDIKRDRRRNILDFCSELKKYVKMVNQGVVKRSRTWHLSSEGVRVDLTSSREWLANFKDTSLTWRQVYPDHVAQPTTWIVRSKDQLIRLVSLLKAHNCRVRLRDAPDISALEVFSFIV